MKKAVYNILPETEKILKIMGEQIKLARLRRSLAAGLVAERAGISRASLWKVEKGDPSCSCFTRFKQPRQGSSSCCKG